jgi:threonine aldolase
MIDLRSDTVTRPSPAMRQAMAKAEVGDDVFGEDPTVNLLQEKCAALLGKEAGLFVASGTMGNQVSIKAQTQPGDEVIVEADSHVFNYEAGAPALLSGVQLFPILGRRGVFTVEQAEAAMRPANVHHPKTRLIVVENTHNRAGGTIWPLEGIRRLRELADLNGLLMHLDGARLWNASAATGIPLKEYADYFDSVTVCFSKGLGAPVGSLVAGGKEFIRKAHRFRKVFGGAMRQAGILAAAALYSMDHHVGRLAEDHLKAKQLAESIRGLPGLSVDMEAVQTNMVFIDLTGPEWTAGSAVEALKARGVLILAMGPRRLRAVTHLDVAKEEIDSAAGIFKEVFHAV